MIPKLEWGALLQAVGWLREAPAAQALPSALPQLPEMLSDDLQADEAFLRQLHTVLFDVHLIEGQLVCPESGREFPVEKGIPNMLLADDEVGEPTSKEHPLPDSSGAQS